MSLVLCGSVLCGSEWRVVGFAVSIDNSTPRMRSSHATNILHLERHIVIISHTQTVHCNTPWVSRSEACTGSKNCRIDRIRWKTIENVGRWWGSVKETLTPEVGSVEQRLLAKYYSQYCTLKKKKMLILVIPTLCQHESIKSMPLLLQRELCIHPYERK